MLKTDPITYSSIAIYNKSMKLKKKTDFVADFKDTKYERS